MTSHSVRVLHIADSLEGGGAEAVFRATVQASDELGFVTSTFTGNQRHNPFEYVFSFQTVLRLLRKLRQFEPNVVHIQNYYHYLSPSVLWAIRRFKRKQARAGRSVRVIFTAHDFHLLAPNSGYQYFEHSRAINISVEESPIRLRRVWDQRSRIHSWLKLCQYVLAYRFLELQNVFDYVLCPSDFLAGLIRRVLPEKTVLTLRNPLSEAAIPLIQSSEPTSALTTVSIASRLSPEKGIKEFVELIGREQTVHDVEIHLFGSGPALHDIQDTAQDLGVNLVTHGHMSSSQLHQALAKNDLLALPSIWYENAPLILIEAASLGVPTITNNIGGMAELSRLCRASYAIDIHNAATVAAAIRESRRRRGENGLYAPEQFAGSNFRSQLSELYLSSGPPTPMDD